MVVNAAGFCIGKKCSDGQIVEIMVLWEIVCQVFWMVAVNDLSMLEKGVTMGRMFVSACGVS